MSFGQGGPSWGGPGAPGQGQGQGQSQGQGPGQGPGPHGPQDPYGTRTPDWSALAEASASRVRRKRWLLIGGGAVATIAIAAVVATAVVSMNSDEGPGPGSSTDALPPTGSLPDEPTEDQPSFPSTNAAPPPDPKDYVSSADKDKAPLNAGTLFPGTKMKLDDRVYTKGATNRTTSCSAATQGRLGGILAANGCDQVIRATYYKGGVAVTVGVAVFDKEAQAQKARNAAKDGIASLPGSGVPTFCRAPSICRKTTNSYGRYVYFTVGGFTNGSNVTLKDKDVYTAGDDVAEVTFQQILARGRAQASAAATAPPADE
jgi:hypothetical protein